VRAETERAGSAGDQHGMSKARNSPPGESRDREGRVSSDQHGMSEARNSPPGESRDREGRVSRRPTWDELVRPGTHRPGTHLLVRAETERAGSAGDQHGMSEARNSQAGESRDREGRVSRRPTWDERGQELTPPGESRDREGRVSR
jgi:hypothetical protein